MSLDAAALPDDVETLRRLVLEQRRQSEQLAEQLEQARSGLIEKALEIEKLKAQLARLRRMTFGRSSEKLDRQIEQLELMLGDLEETLGQSEQRVPDHPAAEARDKPVRRPLPDHLPREEVVHAAACSCPSCGGELRRLGEDVTEVLEYRPGRSSRSGEWKRASATSWATSTRYRLSPRSPTTAAAPPTSPSSSTLRSRLCKGET